MGLLKEFKEFAMKGNVMDMAVGIIIGGAFGGIVQSFIKDVIMPIVGMAGKADFSQQYIPLNEGAKKAVEAAGGTLPLEEARTAGSVLAWGNFVTVFINFLILAFVIFMMIKIMNNMRKKEAAAPAPPPGPTPDQKLLMEIRDALKAKA
ncbi:MAG: large conductance mechanosensitive channel protein MscL [Phycisphaerales bacterium]|nr:large conductance mechanosensitive channel protein MscL [Phycisphaerales bacterium]